jgi:hypothetical protein
MDVPSEAFGPLFSVLRNFCRAYSTEPCAAGCSSWRKATFLLERKVIVFIMITMITFIGVDRLHKLTSPLGCYQSRVFSDQLLSEQSPSFLHSARPYLVGFTGHKLQNVCIELIFALLGVRV